MIGYTEKQLLRGAGKLLLTALGAGAFLALLGAIDSAAEYMADRYPLGTKNTLPPTFYAAKPL